MKNTFKGFTLIELLVTIGILAVLATVVVLVLNPAELFRQARDTQRISDITAVRSAINFALATESTPQTIVTTGRSSSTGATNCNTGNYAIFSAVCTVTTSAAVDGTGWAGVNLTTAAGGSPLTRLPLDPTPSATLFYAYKGNGSGQYKLGVALESAKYLASHAANAQDGGTAANMYEIGTILTAL